MDEKSKYVQIPEDIVKLLNTEEDEPEIDNENARILTEHLEAMIDDEIHDGDCLIINQNGYRNDGKFLYDAKEHKVVPFAFDLDDYGCIPKEFNVRRFPIHFFSDVLTHNAYVRLDDGLIRQIVRHADFELPNKLTSYFMIGENKYDVIGVPQDCVYPAPLAVSEPFPGALTMRAFERKKYEVGTLEFAVHFMRIFIDTVKDGRIEYQSHDGQESWVEDTLYVMC